MQKIDWLRDWREAREYNSPIVILFDKNGSLTAVAVIMTMLESVKRPNGAIGWMPIDCDHYNKWKAEREARPRCNVCGKYADGFPEGWIGGISSPWLCPECRNKPCCATCGTECDTSHYAYANCGVMIGEYKMWTPIKPACNGTGTVAKKEES